NDIKTTYKAPTDKCQPYGAWTDSPAVVQISMPPLGPAGHIIDRASMINNTFNVYLYPSSGARDLPGAPTACTGAVLDTVSSCVDFNPPKQGQVVNGNCQAGGSYPCSVIIAVIPIL